MNGLMTVFLMGAQRFDGAQPMQGIRVAFGGSILLSLGTLIVGIAMLAMSILILVKVVNMEKMIRREQQGEQKEQGKE